MVTVLEPKEGRTREPKARSVFFSRVMGWMTMALAVAVALAEVGWAWAVWAMTSAAAPITHFRERIRTSLENLRLRPKAGRSREFTLGIALSSGENLVVGG